MNAVPAPVRIGMVCLGNICRSPMADVVMNAKVAERGWDDVVQVASCGTGDWHVGHPMDGRAAAALRAAGYDPSHHRAQQVGATWAGYDLLLAMDGDNLADLTELADRGVLVGPRLALFRSFDPDGTGDVPDPYYGGEAGFAAVLAMVERTTDALIEALESGLTSDTLKAP